MNINNCFDYVWFSQKKINSRDCRRIRTYEGISQRITWWFQVRRLNHSARQPLCYDPLQQWPNSYRLRASSSASFCFIVEGWGGTLGWEGSGGIWEMSYLWNVLSYDMPTWHLLSFSKSLRIPLECSLILTSSLDWSHHKFYFLKADA
jgi:hypothetical protein